MALVDMPLEQLKQYKGSSPLPKDFDSYWRRGLEEMDQVDPQVSLVPYPMRSRHADCFEMTFTGVRGARVYAKLLMPKKIEKPCPVLLMFHGYNSDSGDWSTKLGFAAEGFAVAALDCRGQGGRSQDNSVVKGTTQYGQLIRGLDDHEDNLLMRHIMLDTAQLAKILSGMPKCDPGRIVTFGCSQGGGLALACAALWPKVEKVIACYPFLCDYRRMSKIMGMEMGAYAEIKEYFRWFDPNHEREEEVFNRLGYIDAANLAGRIRGKVLFAATLMDTVCSPSTQFAAFNHITSPKKLLVYQDFGHETLFGHSDKAFDFLTGALDF